MLYRLAPRVLRNYEVKYFLMRLCFKMEEWMGRKNFQKLYDISFVFGSTRFDARVVAAWLMNSNSFKGFS